MILLERTVKTFLASLSCMFLRGYIINPLKHFIRDRKMSYRDCIKFIIWYNGRNNDTEAAEYFKVFKKKKYETMSHQAIGRQRIYIKPDLFIRVYEKVINKIYKTHKHFSEFKGYIIAVCDGSIFDLSNVTLTRGQFNIKPSSIVKKE